MSTPEDQGPSTQPSLLHEYPAVAELLQNLPGDFSVVLRHLNGPDTAAAREYLGQVISLINARLHDTAMEAERLRLQQAALAAEVGGARQGVAGATPTTHASAAPTPQPTPPNPLPTLFQRPRAADPPVFSGNEPSPSLRQEEYTNWRSLIRVKFALDSGAFPTPVDKILFTASRLGGDAYTRVRTAVEEVATNPTAAFWPCGWRDFDDLLASLNLVYVVEDVVAMSRREFESHAQKSTPYADFISHFIRLADLCGYPNILRVEALRQKVNRGLQDALVSVVSRPPIEDFEGWVTLFRQLSNNVADRAFRQSYYATAPSATPPSRAMNAPDAMQLDYIPTVRKGSDTAEGKRRREKGLCFYCGKGGHYAADCAARRTNEAKQAGKD